MKLIGTKENTNFKLKDLVIIILSLLVLILTIVNIYWILKYQSYKTDKTMTEIESSDKTLNEENSIAIYDTSNNDKTDSVDVQFTFIDTSKLKNLLFDGVYLCGTDFPPGEYYYISLCGEHDGCILKSLHMEKGDLTEKLWCSILLPAKDFDMTGDLTRYGIYEIGKDLRAGQYRLKPITDEYSNDQCNIHVSGNINAYQISEGLPTGNKIIECDRLTGKQAYISVKVGQYLMVNNMTLTYIGE